MACADSGDTTSSSSTTTSGTTSSTGGGGGTGGDATGGSGATGGSAGAGGGMPGGTCLEENGVLQFTCNPVTNEPCGMDMACDISGMSNFDCATDNTAGLGQPCNQENGPYCLPTLTCFMPDPMDPDGVGSLTTCARYCCSNDVCAPGEVCTKTLNGGAWFPQTPLLGVCMTP
jgi:hypothetical protein